MAKLGKPAVRVKGAELQRRKGRKGEGRVGLKLASDARRGSERDSDVAQLKFRSGFPLKFSNLK